ncbi:MAG: enoyl-CoA hydratase/isomerase family protein [Bdellovibrionales bacterium]
MNYRHLEFKLLSDVAPSGQVGLLTLNRPSSLNALNAEVIEDLQKWIDWAETQEALRCVIITGAGEKAFVAGADIKEMQSYSFEQAERMSLTGQKVFQQIEDAKFVSIAAVNGFALGGGLELAMACDFMVASNTAKFGLPEVSLGLIPGYGGTQRLPRFIGKALARLIALTGDIYPAQQGYEWGLISQVVEPAELMPTCFEFAKTIASRAPLAVAMAKQAINFGFEQAQSEGLEQEADLFAKTFSTEDQSEGINAFIEKRKPVFKGV